MITISGLTARIAGRLLIENASVSLPSGVKVGLVGRNGTGKSTLFRIITGDSPQRPAASRCRRTRASARWRRKRRARTTR
jgi:ATPase subunit of ABC transporter with duplicated ATPase domains